MAMQLLLTLDLTFRKGIIHRDIKPSNVLLSNISDLEVKLADFGLSIYSHDKSSLNMRCGSPGFIAPEILKKDPYGVKSDVFSLGCLLFYVLTGKSLFRGKNVKEVLLQNQFSDPSETLLDYAPS